VRIYVDMPSELDLPLGERLAQAFGIKRAIVVRVNEDQPDSTASMIGSAAAIYLENVINANDVVGISWGATLTNAVNSISHLAPVDIVQLVGGVSAGEMDIGGVELVRRLSEKTGGSTYPLHAPLLVRSAEMAAALRGDPSLASAIKRFDKLTIAVVGIGSWSSARSSLFNEFNEKERREILEAGATGDVCAIVFDAGGMPVKSVALDRTIGISLAELQAVPEVVAVAGGPEKVSAIAAVLKSGVINSLVTDSQTAARLLELAQN
jgi:DNA-binding transcriptional regulator LsrR (DeoR family)